MRMVEASPKVKLFIEPSRTGNTFINNFFLIFRKKKNERDYFIECMQVKLLRFGVFYGEVGQYL